MSHPSTSPTGPSTTDRIHRPLSRRAVLVGGGATLFLAACSGGSKASGPTSSIPEQGPSLLNFFPQNGYFEAGVPQRVAFGLVMPGAGAPAENGPASLTFTITAPDGTDTTHAVDAYGEGLAYSYYPVHFTPEKPGNYTARALIDGEPTEKAVFEVVEKGKSGVAGPTDAMPALTTPTTDDTLGVDPICTNTPECPFHATSLDRALEEDRPVLYFVGTPKFCQTGLCGPVLDVLEKVVPDYGDRITVIHQEVFQSANAAAEDGYNAPMTAAMGELNLPSEPVLFIVGADGKIRYRLDAIYDAKELGEAIDDVLA